jgi:hypothetical protein
MSGGAFDYQQYRINDIVCEIERIIAKEESEPKTKQENSNQLQLKLPETFWELAPTGEFYILTIRIRNAPNVFHRVMQRVVLGFKYEYVG